MIITPSHQLGVDRSHGPWRDRDPQSGPGQMHVLDYDTPEGPKRLRSASIQKRGREVKSAVES